MSFVSRKVEGRRREDVVSARFPVALAEELRRRPWRAGRDRKELS
jgi:hypothetical protein